MADARKRLAPTPEPETKTDVFEVYGPDASSRGWDFMVVLPKDLEHHIAMSSDALDEGEEIRIIFKRYTQAQMNEVVYE